MCDAATGCGSASLSYMDGGIAASPAESNAEPSADSNDFSPPAGGALALFGPLPGKAIVTTAAESQAGGSLLRMAMAGGAQLLAYAPAALVLLVPTRAVSNDLPAPKSGGDRAVASSAGQNPAMASPEEEDADEVPADPPSTALVPASPPTVRERVAALRAEVLAIAKSLPLARGMEAEKALRGHLNST